jgi:hypothetical protein
MRWLMRLVAAVVVLGVLTGCDVEANRRGTPLRSVARRWSSLAVEPTAQPSVGEEPNSEKEEPR